MHLLKEGILLGVSKLNQLFLANVSANIFELTELRLSHLICMHKLEEENKLFCLFNS